MSDYELINRDCIKEMQKLIDDGVKVDLIVTDQTEQEKHLKQRVIDAVNDCPKKKVGYLVMEIKDRERQGMTEKRCIITSMKKGIKENPTTKKYLDRMVSDGIEEDTALNIMILAWQNRRQNDE